MPLNLPHRHTAFAAVSAALLFGILAALFLPLGWRFLAATCGDTVFLLRAYVCGVVLGALPAFLLCSLLVKPRHRPNEIPLAFAVVLVPVLTLLPLAKGDAIFEHWFEVLFAALGTPERAYHATLLWGLAGGALNGLAAGVLAASLPAAATRRMRFAGIAAGAVAGALLPHVLPSPAFHVSLRVYGILLTVFAAALAFWHPVTLASRMRRTPLLIALGATALAGVVLVIRPAAPEIPVLFRGPFPYKAAADKGLLPPAPGKNAEGKDGQPAAAPARIVWQRTTPRHAALLYAGVPEFGNVLLFDGLPLMTGAWFNTPRVLDALLAVLYCPETPETEPSPAASAAFIGGHAVPVAVSAASLPLQRLDIHEPVAGLFAAALKATPFAVETNTAPRIRLHRNRARTLSAGKDGHHLVVLAPGPLWKRGALDAFDPSSLRAIRKHLGGPSGVLAVCLDGRGLSPTLLRRVLLSLHETGFTNIQLWNTGVQDYLVTATKGQAARGLAAQDTPDCSGLPSLACQTQRFNDPGFFREASNIHVHRLPDLFTAFVMDHAHATGYIASVTNTPTSSFTAWQTLFNPQAPAHLLETVTRFTAPHPANWRAGPDEEDAFQFELMTNRLAAAFAARGHALKAIRAFATNDLAAAASPLVESRLAWPRLPLVTDLAERLELTGRRFSSINQIAGAAHYFNLLHLLYPNSAPVLDKYAQTLLTLNRTAEAYPLLDRVADLARGMPERRLEKAAVALQLQRWDDARADFELMLEQNPADIIAMTELARLLVRRDTPFHNPANAVALAEKAAKLTGFKDERAVTTLGDIYISTGRALDGTQLKLAFRRKQAEEAREAAHKPPPGPP